MSNYRDVFWVVFFSSSATRSFARLNLGVCLYISSPPTPYTALLDQSLAVPSVPRNAMTTCPLGCLNPLKAHSPDILEGQKVYGDSKYGNGLRHVKRGGKIIVRSFNEGPENTFIEDAKEMC